MQEIDAEEVHAREGLINREREQLVDDLDHLRSDLRTAIVLGSR